jgi:hypothetical protein
VLLVVMLPTSVAALAVTDVGGVIIFGPGDWPMWALIAVALIWTGLAALQAFAVLAVWRTGGKRATS